MTITIHDDQHVEVMVHSIGDYPLVLQRNSTSGGRESLNEGESRDIINVVFFNSPSFSFILGSFVEISDGRSGFFIFTTRGASCEHPRDYIYMPWGYSPWISAATSTYIPTTTRMTTIFFLTSTSLINSAFSFKSPSRSVFSLLLSLCAAFLL